MPKKWLSLEDVLVERGSMSGFCFVLNYKFPTLLVCIKPQASVTFCSVASYVDKVMQSLSRIQRESCRYRDTLAVDID